MKHRAHPVPRSGLKLLVADGEDWTGRFPALARAAAALPVREALLDGAVSALLPDGTTSRAALEDNGAASTYFLSDLLHLDGQDLRDSYAVATPPRGSALDVPVAADAGNRAPCGGEEIR